MKLCSIPLFSMHGAGHTVYFWPKKMSSMRRILATILGAIFRFLKTKSDKTFGPWTGHWKGLIMPGVCYLNMYVSCCRRTFTFQMTGRQKYTAAMTGTIQGPIYLHLAQEWLSWCDSGLWGWLAGRGTPGSLGCLPSSACQELAPASTDHLVSFWK